jgi:hypothetical protein
MKSVFYTAPLAIAALGFSAIGNATTTEMAVEGDKSETYKYEFTADLELSSIGHTAGGTTGTSDTMAVAGYALRMLIPSMAVGPKIGYSKVTGDYKTVSGDSETDTKSENITTSFGVLSKYYFGDLNTDSTVPFAHLGYTIDSTESTSNDDDTVSLAGSTADFGGGAHIFFRSNFALTPKFNYQLKTTEAPEGEDEGAENNGWRVALGLSTFM